MDVRRVWGRWARWASKERRRRCGYWERSPLKRMIENFKLLFRLYSQPAEAMSGILDRGSLLFASLAVLAVSFVLHYSYTVLLVLAAVYVPGTLLIARLLGKYGCVSAGLLAAADLRGYGMDCRASAAAP